MSDPRIQRISDAIRVIPNFPKPGILFQDVTTILLDPEAFKASIDIMAEKYASEGVDVIAGTILLLLLLLLLQGVQLSRRGSTTLLHPIPLHMRVLTPMISNM